MCDALKFFCGWDWETVLAALIGALFLVIGYLIQGYFDRREKRRENYKEAYFEFLQGDAESQVRGVMDELYEDSLPSDEEQRKIKISDDKIKEKWQHCHREINFYYMEAIKLYRLTFLLWNMLMNRQKQRMKTGRLRTEWRFCGMKYLLP